MDGVEWGSEAFWSDKEALKAKTRDWGDYYDWICAFSTLMQKHYSTYEFQLVENKELE